MGSVESSTSWCMVALGQYGAESLNLKINGDTDRPTVQSAFLKVGKLNAEFCNLRTVRLVSEEKT